MFVVIFGRMSCPFCVRAKHLVDQQHIGGFTEFDQFVRDKQLMAS